MIAIDCEYIPENAPQGDNPGIRPDVEKVYCEVIQIGACKIDDSGNEIQTLNITIKPNLIPHIPPWLIKMTGMTDQKRLIGLNFADGLKQLKDFVGDDNDVWTFNGDWWVLEGNAKKLNVDFPFQVPFKRLKPQLENFNIRIDDFKAKGLNEISSGGLYKVLNIKLPEIEGVGVHDAAHDARSLGFSIYKLKHTS